MIVKILLTISLFILIHLLGQRLRLLLTGTAKFRRPLGLMHIFAFEGFKLFISSAAACYLLGPVMGIASGISDIVLTCFTGTLFAVPSAFLIYCRLTVSSKRNLVFSLITALMHIESPMFSHKFDNCEYASEILVHYMEALLTKEQFSEFAKACRKLRPDEALASVLILLNQRRDQIVFEGDDEDCFGDVVKAAKHIVPASYQANACES